jgi:metal-dependent hydrolase (beta-lactamase superfamily II)
LDCCCGAGTYTLPAARLVGKEGLVYAVDVNNGELNDLKQGVSLGIYPKEIDLVVLSHIHGDHVGGLPSFLEKNPEVVVYLPKSFPKGFKDKLKEYEAKIVEVQEPLKICQ